MSEQSQHLSIRLAECSNAVRFDHRDSELADRILAAANEVWDLNERLARLQRELDFAQEVEAGLWAEAERLSSEAQK